MRCAVHPSRPAFDTCPVCDRPRCALDAQLGSQGCASCVARRATRAPALAAGPAALASLAAGAATANLVTILGGGIASEYVGAKVFSVLMPGLVGAAIGGCSLAVARAASRRGRLPEGMRSSLRVLAAAHAVLSALYGFRFANTAYGTTGRWLPPVLAAALGAWLWTLPPQESGGSRLRPGQRAKRPS